MGRFRAAARLIPKQLSKKPAKRKKATRDIVRSSNIVRLLAKILRNTAGVIGIRLLLFTSTPPLSLARGVAVPEKVSLAGGGCPPSEFAMLSPETLEGVCLERAAATREDNCV